MKKLITLLFIGILGVNAFGQWSSVGQTIYTSSNEILLNYSNNANSTLWLNRNNSGPANRGHYYIKAYDYWGAYLHFVGTGDQDNERMTVTFDGNVGVGTVKPNAKFAVEGGDIYVGSEDNSNGRRRQIRVYGYDNNAQFYGSLHSNFDNNIRTFDISTNSTTQQLKLDVSSNPTGKILLLPGSASGVGIGTTSSGSWSAKLVVNNPDNYAKIIQLGAEGPTTWFMGITDKAGNYFHIGENNNKRIVINKMNGYVGIGITTPEAKLDVDGTIRAEEIKVEEIAATNLNLNGDLAANNITVKANGNTADFVFEDNYQLKDLSEVEKFIKTNKHLPEIPSAEKMETQGVNLAEMNKLLLQKVEELTLYTIKQEEKLNQKDNEIKEIKADRSKETEEREKLEERLARLEALLQTTPNP